MEPYTHEDDNGNTLTIDCAGFFGEISVDAADGRAFPEDLPKITRELYKAAGLPSPVILACPPIPEDGEWQSDGNSLLRVSRDRDRLTVRTTMDGGAAVLSPADARAMAAVLATLADEAEAEPNPEEVDALAAAIMREHNPGAMRLDGARPFARTALRWMNAKAKRDA
jgi:hypothetical protein